MKLISVIAIFLLLVSYKAATGHDITGPRPKAILVQLRSENSRIKGLTATHRTDLLPQLKTDAAAIRAAMTADFKDNFKFCPVYYFMDSNSDKVINKQFEHVLMNADGTYAANLPINGGSTDYLIVYFGSPVFQGLLEKVVADSARYKYDPNHISFVGLVVCNDSMQQMTFAYLRSYPKRLKKGQENKYFYSSSKFEMLYYPFAKNLDRKLKNKFK